MGTQGETSLQVPLLSWIFHLSAGKTTTASPGPGGALLVRNGVRSYCLLPADH